MENIDKSKLITPMLILVSSLISIVIMIIRQYDFYNMLWTLLIVMIIFFVIGDVVSYIYMRIKPRVIPEADDIERLLTKVDTSKLQLDESLLQQYMVTEDDLPNDIPEKVLKEAQRFSVDDSELFEGTDNYQDDTFMDEQTQDF